MAFQVHQFIGRQQSMSRSTIKIALSKRGKSPAMAAVTVPDALAKEWGWVDNDLVVIGIGTGEDAGKISLQRNNNSKDATTRCNRIELRRGVFWRVRLGIIEQLPDRREAARACKYEMSNGSLILTMPTFINSGDLTTTKKEKLVEVSPVQHPREPDEKVTIASPVEQPKPSTKLKTTPLSKAERMRRDAKAMEEAMNAFPGKHRG